MRVITGTARGRKLQALPGEEVRPTAERIKEAVFSIIQFDVEGRRFLDLFAGSGQMGIEALSRGAAQAVFIDSSPRAVEVIGKNLRTAGLAEKAAVYLGDYFSVLKRISGPFDIAYLDPPYHTGLLTKALRDIQCCMSEAGILLCEHAADVTLPEQVGEFKIAKRYAYAKIMVALYRRAGDRA